MNVTGFWAGRDRGHYVETENADEAGMVVYPCIVSFVVGDAVVPSANRKCAAFSGHGCARGLDACTQEDGEGGTL